jgi:toxin CcdB
MTQFDVFANPVSRSRAAYPHVVVLQSDIARRGRWRVVAPTAPRAALAQTVGRLTPVIMIGREEFVLLVTSLTTLPAEHLGEALASVADCTDDISAAIDYMFFGV